jgi:UDP-glucose 4-epimerase
MRILVTGGAGFIGSHLVDSLVGRGDKVLVVDDLSTGRAENLPRAAELVQLDIADARLLDVARAFRPEAITHCAAQPSVAVSMERPLLDARSNILGGLTVREAALAAGCAQLLYITTGGALYGLPAYLPCDEEHPIRPISAYGLSKWTLERYLAMLLPPPYPLKVLRLANIFGPRQDPAGEAGVISIFGGRMLRDEPVVIYGDGEQTRDFVYVGDVVRAHLLALTAPARLTVNVSSADPVSVNELFRRISASIGYGRPALYAPPRPGEMRHSVLANGRARELLGWAPQVVLEDGLRETLSWLRAQVKKSTTLPIAREKE